MTIRDRMRRLAARLSFALAALPAAAQNYSDIWWNPNESGWGLTIADHQTNLFAVWFTYGPSGKPLWLVIPGGTFNADRTVFTGDIYRTSGPPYTDKPFDPARVSITKVGTARISFPPPPGTPESGTFAYQVDGINGQKAIERQPFGSAAPWWSIDATDIWWNRNESGWGLTLAQHGNNLFGVWFTYGANGDPLWIVMPGGAFATNGSFTGKLYTTTGPWFGLPGFNPANVTIGEVGTATVAPDAGGRMTFSSTVSGFTQVKSIERQPFAESAAPNAHPGAETWRERARAIGRGTNVNVEGTGSFIMPEVVIWDDGTWRMYVSAMHLADAGADIWLFESGDEGATWTRRAMVLEGTKVYADPEFQVLGPSLVKLPDGRWRMYYQATRGFDSTNLGAITNPSPTSGPAFQVMSAVSRDGISWTREGVRIPHLYYQPNARPSMAGHGRVIRAPDGNGYYGYFSGPGAIRGYYSADGLTFDPGIDLFVTEGHDPFIARVGGQYVLYVDATRLTDTAGFAYANKLTSADGVTWSAPQKIYFQGRFGEAYTVSGPPPTGVSDIGGVVMPGGRLRLYVNTNGGIGAYDSLD